MPRGRILSSIERRERQRQDLTKLSQRPTTDIERAYAVRIRVREAARNLGKSAVEDAIRHWVETLRGPGSSRCTWQQKNEAASQLSDRFGFPRHQTFAGMEDELAKPKLFELVEYPAPPGWNGDEKQAAAGGQASA